MESWTQPVGNHRGVTLGTRGEFRGEFQAIHLGSIGVRPGGPRRILSGGM